LAGEKMREQDIRFISGDYQFAGTLATPDAGGSFPAVLFIPGSGQVDRDENHKKLRLNVFAELASHFADNGIATLRYDKRGVGASGGNFWETGFHDNAEDATAAFDFLKTQGNIMSDKIFVLGHSEGAYISVKLAAEGVGFAGVILLAGGAKSGEATLKWQAIQITRGMKGLNGWLIRTLRIDVAKSQQKQLDKIKKSNRDYIRVQLIAKLNARWLREFLAYNPARDLPEIKVPMLAITGEKDIQVDPNDLKIMAEIVKAPFEYHALPDLSHLLRTEEGEASISNYKQAVTQPVDPRILQLTLEWLQRHIGS
jgi:alpha-beta hydrolase superfamily lysophospholipase